MKNFIILILVILLIATNIFPRVEPCATEVFNSPVFATYDQYNKMIMIKTEGLTPDQVETVLLHEYKHFIQDYNNELTIKTVEELEKEARIFENNYSICKNGGN